MWFGVSSMGCMVLWWHDFLQCVQCVRDVSDLRGFGGAFVGFV